MTRGKRSEAGGSRTPSQHRHKTELGSSVAPQTQLPRRLAKPTRRPLPPSVQGRRTPPAPASPAFAGSVRLFFQGTGRVVAAFPFPTGERENAAPLSCHLRESQSGARNLRLTARRLRSLSAGGKTAKKLGSGFLGGGGWRWVWLLAERRVGCEGKKTGGKAEVQPGGNLCSVRIEAKMEGTERLESRASGLKRLARA